MRLWLFGYSTSEVAAVNRLLLAEGWPEAGVILPAQGQARVDQILAGAAPESPPLVSQEKLALFQDASEDDICRFLGAYGRQPWPQPLWAAVTEVSRAWPFARLLQELQRERDEIRRQAESFPELE